MAKNYDSSKVLNLEVPFNFKRGSAGPVDHYEIWTSLDNAKTYARENPVAYVGLLITVIEDGAAKCYVIKNTAGDLQPVGNTEIQCLTVDNNLDYHQDKVVDGLSVVNTDSLTYIDLVEHDKILDNTLYSVSGSGLNAFNRRILNVATPINNNDAANKKYVDDNNSIQEVELQSEVLLPTKEVLEQGKQYVLLSLIKLRNLFDIPEEAIIDGKVNVSKMSFKIKDEFEHTTDEFYITVEIFENNTDIFDLFSYEKFNNLSSVAMAATAGAHLPGNTVTLTFNNCRLDPDKIYILSWLQYVRTQQKTVIMYGNFLLMQCADCSMIYGSWDDELGGTRIDAADWKTEGLIPAITSMQVLTTKSEDLHNIRKYSLAMKNIILQTNVDEYYQIKIQNGQVIAVKL